MRCAPSLGPIGPVAHGYIKHTILRPRSMVGGDLYWFWAPYRLYGMVDHVRAGYDFVSLSYVQFPSQVYGIKAFEDGEGFASAAGTFPCPLLAKY